MITRIWAAIKRHPYFTAANLILTGLAIFLLAHPASAGRRMLAGDYILFACALAGIVFMATYALTARWYRSLEGWNLMAMAASLTAVVLLNTSSRIFGPDYWGRPELRIITYSILLGVLIQRVGWLVAVQIRRRKK